MNWIILRCAAASTVPLARSLERQGYEGQIWCPKMNCSDRSGRSRSRKQAEEPLLPTYVFAHADRLSDLMEEQRSPVSNHAPFSVMTLHRRIALVRDRQLDALRLEEAKAAPKQKAPSFPSGTLVRTTEGGFEGVDGFVVSSKGQWSFVEFEGMPVPVKIRTFLLLRNER